MKLDYRASHATQLLVARIDAPLSEAQRRGLMKFFNGEYRRACRCQHPRLAD
jgi:hypothetical protein